jgi:hypothetical protein
MKEWAESEAVAGSRDRSGRAITKILTKKYRVVPGDTLCSRNWKAAGPGRGAAGAGTGCGCAWKGRGRLGVTGEEQSHHGR